MADAEPTTWTGADFERLSWHDNHIHAVRFVVGDPEADDWTCDLVLDIDHIVEWVARPGGGMHFRIAPATLAFHGVTDQRIDIGWEPSGFRVCYGLPSIHEIRREPVPDQQVFFDRPYYHWTIALNAPQDGIISFGAYGFTQTLRATPVERDQQHLDRHRG